MSQPLWSQLITLVKLDNKLATLHNEISTLESLILKDEEELATLKGTLETKDQGLLEKKKKINSAELTIKSLDALEKEKKDKLKQIKNEKEYIAIEKELSVMATQRQDEEDILVTLWQEIETYENKLTKDKSSAQENTQKLEEEQNSSKEKIKEINSSVKKLLNERKEKSDEIPKQWLDTYNKMSKKVSDPIVSVVNSSCSHCYYHVLPQDLSRIKKGGLLHCRSCFRLLYKEGEEASAS